MPRVFTAQAKNVGNSVTIGQVQPDQPGLLLLLPLVLLLVIILAAILSAPQTDFEE